MNRSPLVGEVIETAGLDSTVSFAVAPVPVPAPAYVTVPVPLSSIPALDACTLTDGVQLPPALSTPPLNAIVALPGAAVSVPPPHVPVAEVGLAVVSPDGSASVKPTPVSGTS
ncbi:MAG TPA: hypothetical protein VMA77_11820 [Solirubrobacteraceae bacterium]|nr:hypothetical protein [Solirubrobacteraceae bacterium]